MAWLHSSGGRPFWPPVITCLPRAFGLQFMLLVDVLMTGPALMFPGWSISKPQEPVPLRKAHQTS